MWKVAYDRPRATEMRAAAEAAESGGGALDDVEAGGEVAKVEERSQSSGASSTTSMKHETLKRWTNALAARMAVKSRRTVVMSHVLLGMVVIAGVGCYAATNEWLLTSITAHNIERMDAIGSMRYQIMYALTALALNWQVIRILSSTHEQRSSGR
jgi:hypothetical protein